MDNLVYSSAVLTLSQTTEFARSKTIDTTILHLIVSKNLSGFSVRDLYNSIQGEFPIRFEEICKSIIRSIKKCYIDLITGDINNIENAKLKISKILVNKIEDQSNVIKSFLTDSVQELFIEKIDENNREDFENLLLDSVSLLMSKYGYAYAGQLAGIGDATAFVPSKDLTEICKKSIERHKIDITHEELTNAISSLFDRRDPCLNNLAFSICNKYYQARLLGLDLPIDFLSSNIYKGSTIFLDTNFIMTIAFSKEKRHNEFREILKNAGKLDIHFAASELTIAEIHARVDEYMEELSIGEELLPEELIQEVREDILQSSHSSIENSELKIEDSDNKKRLIEMGVEFIKYKNGDELFTPNELTKVTEELRAFDRKYRASNRAKDERALFHDAYHYFLVNREREKKGATSAWFLTMDHSVIEHGSTKRNEDEPPYSIRLLSILQTLSQFVESQALKGEFTELFGELVAKDLLPQDQLFNYDDLKLLIGFDIKAKEIPPEFVRKATFHIKKNILKGGGITDTNRAEVIHEYTKYLSTPDKNFIELQRKYDKKLKDREDDVKLKDKELSDLQSIFSKKNDEYTQENTTLKTQVENLKQLILIIVITICASGLSLLLWLNNTSFYSSWLDKFNNPFFFNLSVQLFIISTVLFFIFPEKKKWVLIAGLLTTLGSIIGSLA